MGAGADGRAAARDTIAGRDRVRDSVSSAVAWHGPHQPADLRTRPSRDQRSGPLRHLHGQAFTELPQLPSIKRRLTFREAVAAAGLTMTPRQVTLPMPRSALTALLSSTAGSHRRSASSTSSRAFTASGSRTGGGTRSPQHPPLLGPGSARQDGGSRPVVAASHRRTP